MPLITIILLLCAFFGLTITFFRAATKKMRLSVLVSWSLLWIFLGSVALVPEIASFMAGVLGVGRGADAVLYSAIVMIFFILFRIMMRIERIERDITKLVQREALRNIK